MKYLRLAALSLYLSACATPNLNNDIKNESVPYNPETKQQASPNEVIEKVVTKKRPKVRKLENYFPECKITEYPESNSNHIFARFNCDDGQKGIYYAVERIYIDNDGDGFVEEIDETTYEPSWPRITDKDLDQTFISLGTSIFQDGLKKCKEKYGAGKC